MNRPTRLLLIAVALAGYGVYAASFVPALLAAVIALVVTLVMAAYANRQRSLAKD
jgi:hypothetical protein